MSYAGRLLYEKKIRKMFQFANDASFFVMIWSVRLLQIGRSDIASQYLSFPPEAAINTLESQFAVRPWELETILNELLSTPKAKLTRKGAQKMLRCDSFSTVRSLVDTLRRWENSFDRQILQKRSVLREMSRLAQRQFEWQRGFSSISSLYRAYFIYSGNLSRAHFEKRHGISLEDFTFTCFALHAIWMKQPFISRNIDLSSIGICPHNVNLVIDVISLNLHEARALARKERSEINHVAYKKSIFRTYPCVMFGDEKENIAAPLPDLILLRSTSGIFYDIVGGQGQIRNEIGIKFEQYCNKLLRLIFSPHDVYSNIKYMVQKNLIECPDIIIIRNSRVKLAIECKATRLAYMAAYSPDPIRLAPRGYLELAKGVFQIWRFASNCRRGFIPLASEESSFVGLILTLDPWLIMSGEMQKDVINMARTIASSYGDEVSPEDMVPVAFASVGDLEDTYRTCSDGSFLKAVERLASDEYQGWMLNNVHDTLEMEARQNNEYPFEEEMVSVVPWWSILRDGKKRGGLIQK